MSSETSTETLAASRAGVRDGDPGFPPHRASVRDGDPGLEPWQLFTLAGLIGATITVFVSRGQTPAGIILLSLTIFTAAIVGVAVWRTLAPFTGSGVAAGVRTGGAGGDRSRRDAAACSVMTRTDSHLDP